MAIDPKLLVVKPVDELPQNNELAVGDLFLSYNAQTKQLQKTDWGTAIADLASGWTEQTHEEAYTRTDSKKVIIKKVIGYFGGAGTIPTALSDNIGKYYKIGGGFTLNKEEAENYLPSVSVKDKVTAIDKTDAVSGNAVFKFVKSENSNSANKDDIFETSHYSGAISNLNTTDSALLSAFNNVPSAISGVLSRIKGVFKQDGNLKVAVFAPATSANTYIVKSITSVPVIAGEFEFDVSKYGIEVKQGDFVGYDKSGTARPTHGVNAGLSFGWVQTEENLVEGGSVFGNKVAAANTNFDFEVISGVGDIAVKEDLFTVITNNAFINGNVAPTAGLANNAPAVTSGAIRSIKINAHAVGTARFQILDRKTFNAKNAGHSDAFTAVKTFDIPITHAGIIELKPTDEILISKGQFLMQTNVLGFVGPKFGGASDGHLGWWQTGNDQITGTVSLTYQPSESVALTFDIESEKYQRRQDESVETVRVTVVRNSENYNSVRNAIKAITDAAPNKIYEVIIPPGIYRETDLTGKPFVKIKGSGRNSTFLRCDIAGDMSDFIAPSDYYFASERGKMLKNIQQHLRHLFFVSADTHVEDLSIEAVDCKYPVHIDNIGYKSAYFKNVRIYEKNCNYPIGIGINGGQKIEFEGCIIERHYTGQLGVFAHNAANQTAKAVLNIKNCRFVNCSYVNVDELGSNNPDELNLINCSTNENVRQLRLMVDKNGDGKTYWINPTTGVNEPNPVNVPYCWVVNTSGTKIAEVLPSDSGTFNPAWVGIPQRDIAIFKKYSIVDE